MAELLHLAVRDTDADWREIGDSQPFWGVLTQPEYLRENIDSENLATFYASGARFIASVAVEFERIAATRFHATTALDFGCGVGRLTEAMTAYSDDVVGYDISPGMLQEARTFSAGKAAYTDQLPDGQFSWINSWIVFQHIPPERGLVLLRELLARLTPAGFVSLHFTIYRDDIHKPPIPEPLPPPAPPKRRSLLRRLHILPAKKPPPPPEPFTPEEPVRGTIFMYDYDLNQIYEVLHSVGIERLLLIHTDHGGHHGVKIFGRRKERSSGEG